MRINFYKNYIIVIILLIAVSAKAEIELPSVFSDNMVLQQKANVTVWGKATPGATVNLTVSWNKRLYPAKVDADGNWRVQLQTLSHGGPYELTIAEGAHRVVLKNVLLGDVWLCSGQSNMEMPLAGWGKILNYQQEIEKANFADIRLLQATHVTANQPINNLTVRNKGWDVCTPETVAEFSAVAYSFAKTIYEKTKIPIGLIHSSWGGTIAEAWTSFETLQTLPDFASAALKIKNTPMVEASLYSEQMKDWNEKRKAFDKGYKGTEPIWAADNINTADWKTMELPGVWESKGLPDLDGVVWFRRKINIPEDWSGKELQLSLSTIDDDDVTFFNGRQVGTTTGYNLDRKYTVPADLVRKGDNFITVRVEDNSGGGGFSGLAKEMFLGTADGKQINLSGEWLYAIAYDLKDIPAAPVSPSDPNRPTVLYNAMIHPIISYTIKGAIWYQGESNAGRAYQYRTLFPAMIQDWRSKFSSGTFPFYFVQLANFMQRKEQPGNSAWAELREAQLQATKLPNTGMATIIDIGDAADIHPKNKQEVGRRLALIALAKDYHLKNEYAGPLFVSQKKLGNKMVLTFSHANGMKATRGTILKSFEIAGADKKFYWADASINGNTISVSSSSVPNPVAVRYAWADNPEANLINAAGLPASPFRTDDWDGVTKTAK